MKILITQDTDWIQRNPGHQHNIAERLQLKGHEIRVVDFELLWQNNEKKELFSKRTIYTNITKVFKNAKIMVIRPRIIKIPVLDYISMLYTYHKEIKYQLIDFQPDIVIGYSIITNYISMRLAKKMRIPYIFCLTDALHTIIPIKIFKPIGKLIESINLKNADKIVVINNELQNYAIKMGANPSHISVIELGFDIHRYDPNINSNLLREKYGITNTDIVIFFMGWLYHFSGLKEVAFELQKINNPNVKLLIVGDGDAFNDLENIKNRYGLHNRIILTGKQPYDLIPQYISISDICILPAYNNDVMRYIVPIKIYEYMAMGKSIVSTKLPGVQREFGYDHGIVYVDKPQDVLAKALELYNNKTYLINGFKARSFIEHYDWDTITLKFEDLLSSMKRN
jgi:glycosyltransferase involved in cell wall biosynthesis